MKIMIVVVEWWWIHDLCSCYVIGNMKVMELSYWWCFKLCFSWIKLLLWKLWCIKWKL